MSRQTDSEVLPDGGDETAETAAEYMAGHALVRALGDTPRIRILAAFLDADQPMNPATIAEQAAIERTTWYNHSDELLDTGLIVQDGKAGNSPLYRLADPDRDDVLAEGDRRAEWLDKIADFTGAAVHGGGE